MTILQNHHVLAVHDVHRSAAFYVHALGFDIVDEPAGWIFVRKDQTLIMLGECPDDMAPSELGCHSYFAYLRVDDLDAWHAAVLGSDFAGNVGAIADEPWGMRECLVTTPDGHRIKIGQVSSRGLVEARRPEARGPAGARLGAGGDAG
jgi:catechol 2,3-dioxygenase-like lactoylglutathione lyase family enzyme